MKFLFHTRVLLAIFLFLTLPKLIFAAAPSNDNCSGATGAYLLTSSTTCTNSNFTLDQSTTTALTGCLSGAHYDVWFSFVASGTTHTVTIGGFAATTTITNPEVQIYSGTCGGTLTAQACGATTATATTLVSGTTYYIRVSNVGSDPSGNGQKPKFDICVTHPQQPPSNDLCSAPISLTSTTTCTNTAGTLLGASVSSAAVTSSCTGTPGGDVWYSFVAQAAFTTITMSSIQGSITTEYIQLFSGSCGSFTSLGCVSGNGSSLSLNTATYPGGAGLTVGATYYIRIYSQSVAPLGTNWGFDICVAHTPPPANDDCSGAVSLTATTNCSNISGTLVSATASSGIPGGCAGAGTHYDVWYSFTAVKNYELISLNASGSNFTNPEIQLFSGSCGTLTSVQCGATSIAASGLSVGATYYVRVSNIGAALSNNGGFSICVYHPTGASYDFGKSYVNLSKNSAGGTINPGDTLEIRATLVVRTNSLDSLSFLDTLHSGGGLKLIPGTIALRTNEGKIYRRDSPVKTAFTDAYDSDAGYTYQNGLDTIVRINIGTGASGTTMGSLSNTSRPSVFGSTCIIMATYRVVVYASFGTSINLGGGGTITVKDPLISISSNLSFPTRNAIVYNSPGLCPNAVSATNALGAESNGTFGTPSGSAPLARNRGTSPYTSYLYNPFSASGGPGDYYYAIANNTSQVYTTTNTYTKPDGTNHRLFGQWDISGDHTGASNLTIGNIACDTTLPVSATNPCGYMLVINSAYKTDTAFTYTINNLCPNTYYELAAWFKNICYKCGCDSTGTASGGVGYIPTATGDSSGVRPNIAFDVNGTDYYTTGDILYYGTTPTGSDATNKWVKRGFTYLTGPSETSFTLTLRNNAPGGGGNDWALDDIAVATCSPNLNFTPSANPTFCSNNVVEISGIVTSYFNNYSYYKWEKSTDNGATWNATGITGTATPAVNGTGAYQYSVDYPQFQGTSADDENQYRLIVATSAASLGNSCSIAGNTRLLLNIDPCVPVLGTNFISFTAKIENTQSVLKWTTNTESEQLKFIIERSLDGYQFTQVATVASHNVYSNALNTYNWSEPYTTGKFYYRVKLAGPHNGEKYSRITSLYAAARGVQFVSIVNPFNSELIADIHSTTAGAVTLQLVDNNGTIVKTQSFTVQDGTNRLRVNNLHHLSAGLYTLKLITDEGMSTKKLIKQ